MSIANSNHFGDSVNLTYQNERINMQDNMLFGKNKLLSKQKNVVSTFSKHFGSITDSLNLFSWPNIISLSDNNPMSAEKDKVNFNIRKFAFHTSKKAIRKKIKLKMNFRLALCLQKPSKEL